MNTIINFRVSSTLRDRATARAKKIGLPLSVVFRNFLSSFVENDDPVIFGQIEKIQLTPALEARAKQLDRIAAKTVAKKLSNKTR